MRKLLAILCLIGFSLDSHGAATVGGGAGGGLSSGQVAGIVNNIAPPNQPVFVFLGDSRSADWQNPGVTNWTLKLMSLSNFTNRGARVNMSFPGLWLSNHLYNFESWYSNASPNPLATNVFTFIFADYNDINNGSTIATMTNTWTNLLTRIRATGSKVVALTPIGIHGTFAKATVKTNFATFIRNNPSYYDYLVDADAAITDYATQTQDNVHPNNTGQALIAAAANAAVTGIPTVRNQGGWINGELRLSPAPNNQWSLQVDGAVKAPLTVRSQDIGATNTELSVLNYDSTEGLDFTPNRIRQVKTSGRSITLESEVVRMSMGDSSFTYGPELQFQEGKNTNRWGMLPFQGSLLYRRYNAAGTYLDQPFQFASSGSAMFAKNVYMDIGDTSLTFSPSLFFNEGLGTNRWDVLSFQGDLLFRRYSAAGAAIDTPLRFDSGGNIVAHKNIYLNFGDPAFAFSPSIYFKDGNGTNRWDITDVGGTLLFRSYSASGASQDTMLSISSLGTVVATNLFVGTTNIIAELASKTSGGGEQNRGLNMGSGTFFFYAGMQNGTNLGINSLSASWPLSISSNSNVATLSAPGALTNVAAVNGWGVAATVANNVLTPFLTNSLSLITSNSLTAQIDFGTAQQNEYRSTDFMRTNLTLQLTNPVPGRDITVRLKGDGNAVDRNVTVSTNGLTGNVIVHWALNSPTNGATALTVTNGLWSEIIFHVSDPTNVFAVHGPYR